MAVIREAGGQGNVRKRQVTFAEFAGSKLDAQAADVVSDRFSAVTFESRRQVYRMNADCSRDLLQAQAFGKPRAKQFFDLPNPPRAAGWPRPGVPANQLSEDFQQQPFDRQR
jgi:hypothetical protein